MKHVTTSLLGLGLVLGAVQARPAHAQPVPPPATATPMAPPVEAAPLPSARDEFGATLGPATLPNGGMAVYGWAGAPDLLVGVRQGFEDFELDARVRADYLDVATGGEVHFRYRAYDGSGLALAPSMGFGLLGNTGATYFNDRNFSGWFARVGPGLVATVRLSETVRLVGLAEGPFDFRLNQGGGWRLQLLGGGGLEVYLGDDMSLLAAGQLGGDFRDRPDRAVSAGVGWAVRLGLGKRVF